MLNADMDIDQIAESVKDFCESVINPMLRQQHAERFQAVWKLCGQFGLLGAHVEQDMGGSGLSVTQALHAMLALGEHCEDAGFAFAINVSLFSPISTLRTACSKDQQRDIVPLLCSGDRICAYALSEEQSGSDAFALSTVATPVTGGFVLKGRKTYISLGSVANDAIVFASTDLARKQWGITAFYVDLTASGVNRTEIPKAGLQSTPMAEIEFGDCFVSQDRMLGKPGSGAAIFEESQQWERSFVWASQIGVMQRQLSKVVEHANKRHQFEQSIGQFQSVSNRIADMRIRLETCRHMLRHTAELRDQGRSIRLESSMCKLHLSESYLQNSLDCARIFAAAGYTHDATAMSELNDAMAGLLLGGTNDIQRNIISRLTGVA
ncbi:MAG: acyl-CoA dehydrogenase family protein [Pseudomonadales bacterium]